MSGFLAFIAIVVMLAFLLMLAVERGWLRENGLAQFLLDAIPVTRRDTLLSAAGALILAAFLCWVAGY